MNFVGCCSAGIVGADLHLRDQRDDLARRARAAQRILDRLLDHVADPSRRCGDEHAERERARLRARELVADQLVADLRSVAVHDADVPAVQREVDDRTEALARVAELVVDRALLASRREGVPAQRDHGGRCIGRRRHRLSRRKLDPPIVAHKLTAARRAARRRARRTRGRTRANRRVAARRACRGRATPRACADRPASTGPAAVVAETRPSAAASVGPDAQRCRRSRSRRARASGWRRPARERRPGSTSAVRRGARRAPARARRAPSRDAVSAARSRSTVPPQRWPSAASGIQLVSRAAPPTDATTPRTRSCPSSSVHDVATPRFGSAMWIGSRDATESARVERREVAYLEAVAAKARRREGERLGPRAVEDGRKRRLQRARERRGAHEQRREAVRPARRDRSRASDASTRRTRPLAAWTSAVAACWK